MPKAKVDSDHLEIYPESKQVSAFPERRFIKTNRFMTIIALVNLALIIAFTGIFIYQARRADVDVRNSQTMHIYRLDPEDKTLKQAEYSQTMVTAKRLALEEYLMRYLTERYSAVFVQEVMVKKWLQENSWLMRTTAKEIRTKLADESKRFMQEVFNRRINRDVHIYNLHPYREDMWTAVVETIDMPVLDDFFKICNCTDNSRECLDCKYKNCLNCEDNNPQNDGRRRYRVWMRVSFKGIKSLDNPLGILVYAYYAGYMPLNGRSISWDLPVELRPDL